MKIVLDSYEEYTPNFVLTINMSFPDEKSRERAVDAINTLFELRKAGVKNLNWALQFRAGCGDEWNSKGVLSVGVDKVKKAYYWFDKEFAKI